MSKIPEEVSMGFVFIIARILTILSAYVFSSFIFLAIAWERPNLKVGETIKFGNEVYEVKRYLGQGTGKLVMEVIQIVPSCKADDICLRSLYFVEPGTENLRNKFRVKIMQSSHDHINLEFPSREVILPKYSDKKTY